MAGGLVIITCPSSLVGVVDAVPARQLIIQGGVFYFVTKVFLLPSRYFYLDVPLLKSSCLRGNWPPCAPQWLKETFRSSFTALMIFTVSSDEGFHLIACSFQTHWRMVSHVFLPPQAVSPVLQFVRTLLLYDPAQWRLFHDTDFNLKPRNSHPTP